MSAYRVVAIPTATAEAVRVTMTSPRYGHPAHLEVATGHGPCRHCLRAFDVGREDRILFTHDAFDGRESLPLPGPVFIHAEACDLYPESGGFPEDLVERELTLNAYGVGRELKAQVWVASGEAEATVGQLFDRDDVAYINVYDTEAGCFDFRLERCKP